MVVSLSKGVVARGTLGRYLLSLYLPSSCRGLLELFCMLLLLLDHIALADDIVDLLMCDEMIML